jgi:hypothetical protein
VDKAKAYANSDASLPQADSVKTEDVGVVEEANTMKPKGAVPQPNIDGDKTDEAESDMVEVVVAKAKCHEVEAASLRTKKVQLKRLWPIPRVKEPDQALQAAREQRNLHAAWGGSVAGGDGGYLCLLLVHGTRGRAAGKQSLQLTVSVSCSWKLETETGT